MGIAMRACQPLLYVARWSNRNASPLASITQYKQNTFNHKLNLWADVLVVVFGRAVIS
jgi:hypothetical protein